MRLIRVIQFVCSQVNVVYCVSIYVIGKVSLMLLRQSKNFIRSLSQIGSWYSMERNELFVAQVIVVVEYDFSLMF